jgi:hypothetical protein
VPEELVPMVQADGVGAQEPITRAAPVQAGAPKSKCLSVQS